MADKEQVEQMMLHALPMAAYQVFEELSDELVGSVTGSLVAMSNRVTVQCLAGEKYRAAELLKDVESLASSTSLFGASRDAGRFRTVAEQYVRETGRGSEEAIDGDLWSLLVVKAESCRAAALSVGDRWLGPMVIQGLMDRFRRRGTSTADGSVPVSRRLMAGSGSSRSLPVLAFYIAVLEPALGFETLNVLQADATLVEALSVAAMLVRLLKDVGAPLLTSDWVRTQFARLLDQKTVARNGKDLASILREEAGEFGDWPARISPDVMRRENNVCLSGLLNLSPDVAIPRLCDRMDYLAGMFSNGRKYLDRLAQDITVQVWCDCPSKLLRRFVEFYERLNAGAIAAGTTEAHRAVA
jgi:hypothetical protein